MEKLLQMLTKNYRVKFLEIKTNNMSSRPIDKNEYKHTKEKYLKLLEDNDIDVDDTEENILIYTFPEIGLKFLEIKKIKIILKISNSVK